MMLVKAKTGKMRKVGSWNSGEKGKGLGWLVLAPKLLGKRHEKGTVECEVKDQTEGKALYHSTMI